MVLAIRNPYMWLFYYNYWLFLLDSLYCLLLLYGLTLNGCLGLLNGLRRSLLNLLLLNFLLLKRLLKLHVLFMITFLD